MRVQPHNLTENRWKKDSVASMKNTYLIEKKKNPQTDVYKSKLPSIPI